MLIVMNPNNPQKGQHYRQPEEPDVQLVPGPTHQGVQQGSVTNPYDFIMNPVAAPKKKKFSVGNKGSLKGKVVKIIAAGVALIILVIIGARLLLGNPSGNASALIELAASQQELVRVSGLGLQKAKDPTVLAFAQTAKLTVSSQNSELLTYLKDKGVKYKPEQLSAAKDTTVDDKLTSAAANNQLDQVFLDTLKNSLGEYRKKLQEDYKSSASQATKDMLSKDYDSVTELLK